ELTTRLSRTYDSRATNVRLAGPERTTREVGAGSAVDDRVGEGAEAFDGDGDGLAGFHRTDAYRGAGEDGVAGQQGHHPRHPFDDLADGVQQHRGVAVLLEFAVQRGAHVEPVLRLERGVDPRAERAECVVPLGPRPLPVGLLLVARGDVV